MTTRGFGTARDGRMASLWTLCAPGLEIDVMDRGATLVAVRVPDRRGEVADVVLGFPGVAGYESPANAYFGCTVGRVCNRIAGASFELDGTRHRLAANEGANHLHGGGPRSFDKVWWRGEVVADGCGPAVRFHHRSPHGEEGYPGLLDVVVTYRVSASRLEIGITGLADRRTPFAPTNHAYWNLAGAGGPTVLDHLLHVRAAHHTPTDDSGIPTGATEPVRGTPLDFTNARPIGERIGALTATPPGGYDHNFVLDGRAPGETIAELRDPASGRWLRIATDEPGLQVYSGNRLRGQRGKGGLAYGPHAAVCLETQHFPDSVHHPRFPATILEPGRQHTTTTVWTFGAS